MVTCLNRSHKNVKMKFTFTSACEFHICKVCEDDVLQCITQNLYLYLSKQCRWHMNWTHLLKYDSLWNFAQFRGECCRPLSLSRYPCMGLLYNQTRTWRCATQRTVSLSTQVCSDFRTAVR